MSAEPAAPAAEQAVDNFTNDSAMMIAWERALESRRGEAALFHDPLAEALAGTKGERLSADFENMCDGDHMEDVVIAAHLTGDDKPFGKHFNEAVEQGVHGACMVDDPASGWTDFVKLEHTTDGFYFLLHL